MTGDGMGDEAPDAHGRAGVLRRPETLCGLGLLAVFAVGIAAPRPPGFDWTFGIEAYRSLGWGPFLGAAAVLLAVLLGDPLAARLATAASAALRRVPVLLRTPLFLALLLLAYLTLTDTSLSGDGAGIVYMAALGKIVPSNPLSSLLHVAGFRILGLEPREVVRLLSCGAGMVFAWTAVGVAREEHEDAGNRAACVVLLVTCASASLFFGSLELYAPVAAALLVYLRVSLRALGGRSTGPWPALALGLLVTLHGSALALLPVLAWTARRARGRWVPLSWAGAFLLPVVVVAVLVIGAWGGQVPPPGAERWGNFLGAQGQSALLPLALTPANVNHRYAFLDVEHLAGVANLLVLSCPAGLGLLLASRGRDRPAGAAGRVLVASTALLLLFPLMWNVSYALRADWDLFAAMGVPLALLAARRLPAGGESTLRAVRVVALALFAFVPLVISHAGDGPQKRRYAEALEDMHARLPEPAPDGKAGRILAVSAQRWRSEARERDPGDVRGSVQRALDLANGGDLTAAEALLREVLSREPGHHRARFYLGEVLLLDGRGDEARAAFREGVRAAPEWDRLRWRRMLAEMDLAAGDETRALRGLERGLREEIGDPVEAVRALRLLAVIRRGRGEGVISRELLRLATRREETGLK